MILPAWTGEGSLDAQTAATVAAAEREGWAALRSLQGDPVADILRYTVSGADPARGISGSKSAVSGLSGIPVLYGDLTAEEAEVHGLRMEDGLSAFEMYTDVEVRDTDLLRYPASTGKVYAVIRSLYDSNIGRCVVYARPAPGSA